jgi:hypothetical protein
MLHYFVLLSDNFPFTDISIPLVSNRFYAPSFIINALVFIKLKFTSFLLFVKPLFEMNLTIQGDEHEGLTPADYVLETVPLQTHRFDQ